MSICPLALTVILLACPTLVRRFASSPCRNPDHDPSLLCHYVSSYWPSSHVLLGNCSPFPLRSRTLSGPLFPTTFPPPLDHLPNLTGMSDRFKVFIEISQQFIHNGNQAYYFDGPSFPTTSPPPLDHLPNLTGVSDRFREFIEIPQQFLHDGNQICYCPKLTFLQFLTRCTKPTQKGTVSLESTSTCL